MSLSKPQVPASAVLLAAAFIAAAVLDAPHVITQILLPLLVAFAVLTNRRGTCFKRREQP